MSQPLESVPYLASYDPSAGYVQSALQRLEFSYNGLRLYRAGLRSAMPVSTGDGMTPLGYPHNFNRDSLQGGMIAGDRGALADQCQFSDQYVGTKIVPLTGEEPHKRHHEIHPELASVIMNGRSTAYNACDTTALYLINRARQIREGEINPSGKIMDLILGATRYILRHLNEQGLFEEDPAYSNTDKYGLQVTYWKDSVLNDPHRTSPAYPIVYTQPHFQNARALGEIGKVLDNKHLQDKAQQMRDAGILHLWRNTHFAAAIDQRGDIDPPSCDSLVTLLDIDPQYLPPDYAAQIEGYMEPLVTDAGYRSGIPVTDSSDVYHTKFVWTHMAAIYHAVGARYDLSRVRSVAARTKGYINPSHPKHPFSELLDAESFEPAGNGLQYWTIRMYQYFQDPARHLL